MHAQDRVVVVGARKLRRRICDEHFDELFDIDSARANHFHADASAEVAVLDDSAFCHGFVLQARRLKAGMMIGLIYRYYVFHRQNGLIRDEWKFISSDISARLPNRETLPVPPRRRGFRNHRFRSRFTSWKTNSARSYSIVCRVLPG